MVEVGDTITKNLPLIEVKTKEEVLLNDLWKDGKVIVKMFRRFGCAMCKYEAVELSRHKQEFDRLNVKMVAVGFSDIGIEPWAENDYWKGNIYLDADRETYKTFGAKDLSSFGVFQAIVNPFTAMAVIPALRRGYTNDPRGNLSQLGATLVVDKGGKILYKFIQEGPSRYPDIKQIVEVVGGDYSAVEESSQVAPESCSADVKVES